MRTITPRIRRAASALPSPTTMATTSVTVHIDALVLHGFSRSSAHRTAGALQRELTRLLAARGLPQVTSLSVGHLDGGTIAAEASRPELTGLRAARALHGGLHP